MNLPISRGLPMIFNIFKKNKVVEKSLVIDNESIIPRKNVYEKIEQIELEIESKINGLELTIIETNKLEAFKEQYNLLKEETNKQVAREKNKDNIELYLKDCNYYQGLLNELLDLIDASLSKYNFFKRLSEFKLDNNDINITIKGILELRCDYTSLNILFSDIEKNYIENCLSNIYFEVILEEIKTLNNSSLFKELSLTEKKNIQLVLMHRIRDNISKTKIKKEHIEELINNIFSLDDFRVYLKLMSKYNRNIVKEKSLVKVK